MNIEFTYKSDLNEYIDKFDEYLLLENNGVLEWIPIYSLEEFKDEQSYRT